MFNLYIFDIVQTCGKSAFTQTNLENNYGQFRKKSIKLFLIDCMFRKGPCFFGVSYTLAVFCVSTVTKTFMHVQIMKCTGRCVAVSEPIAATVVTLKYRKFGDSPELRQLTRDVIRWECRPYWTMQPPPLCYFLKLLLSLPLYR